MGNPAFQHERFIFRQSWGLSGAAGISAFAMLHDLDDAL
jgi:hypothetical protein